MMGNGGLQKVGPEIRQAFIGPAKKKIRKYEDTFPKDLPTIEDVKAKYGTVVWCKFTECKYNQEIDDLQRTSSSIMKNKTYKPIGEQEHIWANICTKDEISIKFQEVEPNKNTTVKVPFCFSAANKTAGHIDFTRFLNSDGTPLGGNIDSQHVSDAGYGAMDADSFYYQ